MNTKNGLVHIQQLQENKQIQELLEKSRTIPAWYEGDIRRFKEYAAETNQSENVQTLLNYLAHSIEQDKIKKTTWERRLAAAKKYLSVTYELHFDEEERKVISDLRKVFTLEDYKDRTHIEGQLATYKSEIMEMIEKMEPRAKAICLVNLITANRPTEMVRLKISDFNFTNRSVSVYLKK